MRYENSRAKRRNDWRRLDADVIELQSLRSVPVDAALSRIGELRSGDIASVRAIIDIAAAIAAVDTGACLDFRSGRAERMDRLQSEVRSAHAYFQEMA